MRNLLLASSLLLAAPLIAQEGKGLAFTAHILGDAHHLGEPLSVEIRVENIGAEAIYVYSDLNYGIRLFAATDDGKYLPRESIIESMPPPPPDRSRFCRLEPGHFLGMVWREGLNGMGIHEAGAYRIQLGYHSNFTRPTRSACGYGMAS